jgi:hypothetical protein
VSQAERHGSEESKRSKGELLSDVWRIGDVALLFSPQGDTEKECRSMRSNVTKPRQVEEAKQTARHVTSNEWTIGLMRLGYATKGVVYLIIGGLAVAVLAT